MAQLLAVDWDRNEVRYLLATTRGGEVRVDMAAAMLLAEPGEGDEDLSGDIGTWLRDELARHGRHRPETLLAVDRASIELLQLTLPPALDEELPELVRNQAMRATGLVTEESLLDFVPLETEPGERKVTAIALSHDQWDRIQGTCRIAGITPKRLLVRPYATASFLSRLPDVGEGSCLLVNRFAVDADLTIVDQGKVVFWRTVRLPSGAEEQVTSDALIAEIGRTLMVAQNQTVVPRIERIVLLGSDAEHRDLVQYLESESSRDVVVVDPFRQVGPRSIPVPETPGRYAALLGMVLDEVEGRSPDVDLLHPRKKPVPPNRKRLLMIGGALVGSLVAALSYLRMEQLSRLDGEATALVARAGELEDLVQQADRQQRALDAIREWQSGDVVLLDELRDLSIRLPDARDMVVLHMTKSASRSGWCVLNLQGLVRDPLVVSRMERSLRDEYHEIRSPRGQGLRQDEAYTWRFESSVTVARRSKEAYRTMGSKPILSEPGGDGPVQPPEVGPGEAPTAESIPLGRSTS